MKVTAIIPSYNPDGQLARVVEELAGAGFARVIVVNDGSGPAYAPIFEQVATMPGCKVLSHPHNMGKGKALRTALEAFLAAPEGDIGVVTLDGDGQHRTEDVAACARALEDRPDSLVLGTRDFSGKDIPARSAFGNKMTRLLLRLCFGVRVCDSQTGLRGIPAGFARRLLDLPGDRYEFETHMLLEAKRCEVPFVEVPIQTIYIDDNAASHFRPVADSLRIYTLLLKFGLSSLLSFVVDISLFALLNLLLAGLPASARYLLATAGARVCSALFNFLLNRTMVFGSKSHPLGAMLRYGVLCVAQMLCSYGGIYLLAEALGVPAVPAKIVVDTLLFFASFQVQRRWVFPPRAECAEPAE